MVLGVAKGGNTDTGGSPKGTKASNAAEAVMGSPPPVKLNHETQSLIITKYLVILYQEGFRGEDYQVVQALY